jgi:hypothetical protein
MVLICWNSKTKTNENRKAKKGEFRRMTQQSIKPSLNLHCTPNDDALNLKEIWKVKLLGWFVLALGNGNGWK